MSNRRGAGRFEGLMGGFGAGNMVPKSVVALVIALVGEPTVPADFPQPGDSVVFRSTDPRTGRPIRVTESGSLSWPSWIWTASRPSDVSRTHPGLMRRVRRLHQVHKIELGLKSPSYHAGFAAPCDGVG